MTEPRREHPISGHSYQSTTTPNSLITVAVVPPNLGFKCGLRLRPRRGLSPQHFTRLDFDLLSVPSSSTVLLISHTRSSSFRSRDFTETRRGRLILSYVRVKIVSLFVRVSYHTREWDLCEIHLCRASVLQPDRPSSSTKYVGIGWCTLHIDTKIDQDFLLFLFLLYICIYIFFFKKFFKRLFKIHLIVISFFTCRLFYGYYYMASYSIERYRIISTF